METTKFNSFGDAVSYIIEKRGIIPQKICDATDIDPSQMSGYLNKGKTPRSKNQNLIKKFLNVSIDQNEYGMWLLREHEPSDSGVSEPKPTGYMTDKEEQIKNLETAEHLIRLTIERLKTEH